MTTSPKETKWWVGALLSPVGGIAVGFGAAMASPKNESDWTGGAFFLFLLVGIAVGCVSSLVCTFLSIRNREPAAWVGVICALIIIVMVGVGVQDVIHSRPR